MIEASTEVRQDLQALKSKVAEYLVNLMNESGQTEKELASTLKTTQPRINSLRNGNYHLFSIEMLLKFTSGMGVCIDIALRPPQQVDMKTIDWNKASDLGLIERINREVLHPLGLAMTRCPDTGISENLLVSPDGEWEYPEDRQTLVKPDEAVRAALAKL